MAMPKAVEWAELTRTSATDAQLNTRLPGQTWIDLAALATELRLSVGALTRLVLTLVVTGETVSADRLRKAAGVSIP
jgi:hypothetical protein